MPYGIATSKNTKITISFIVILNAIIMLFNYSISYSSEWDIDCDIILHGRAEGDSYCRLRHFKDEHPRVSIHRSSRKGKWGKTYACIEMGKVVKFHTEVEMNINGENFSQFANPIESPRWCGMEAAPIINNIIIHKKATYQYIDAHYNKRFGNFEDIDNFIKVWQKAIEFIGDDPFKPSVQ